ncbi:hypothetical protein [Nesterenkonia alba]|uniref:hypothetical protein n=1 Tax=Nesterenkonia alba TaxID=515814 RepID=UPI0003B6EC10|nr:hypothetical protein [Nesterenkonia alba]
MIFIAPLVGYLSLAGFTLFMRTAVQRNWMTPQMRMGLATEETTRTDQVWRASHAHVDGHLRAVVVIGLLWAAALALGMWVNFPRTAMDLIAVSGLVLIGVLMHRARARAHAFAQKFNVHHHLIEEETK